MGGCPLLVGKAAAQRPAAIQASAFVSTSVLAVVVRSDSAPVEERVLAPATERVRIAGAGIIEVQRGPGGQVLVGPLPADARAESTVVVQVSSLGS
jgi:hypothetical protein